MWVFLKIVAILWSLSPFCCAEQYPSVVVKKGAFAVAAYLPEWRFESANYDTICRYSTHLIFFSVEPDFDGNIIGQDRLPPADVLLDARSAAEKYGCKLMLCFGGNGRSNGFSKTVRTKKKRQNFVQNIIKMTKKYRFDGVDLNWEYPVCKLTYV